jgi:hypothetical protein
MEETKPSAAGSIKAEPVEMVNISTTQPTTITDRIAKKKPLSLKKQIQYVKKNFESGEGYLVTIEAKRINQSQAMLHGKVYHMKSGHEDRLAYEGTLTYTIKDPNFQDQEFVIAANLGQESLMQRFEGMLKGNASNVMGTIVQIIGGIGFKLG